MPAFESGQSGNPKGRPRTRDLSADELLKKRVNSPKIKTAIVRKLIEIATASKSENANLLATNLKAIQIIFDRLSGRPAQKSPTKTDEKIEVIFGNSTAS